MVENNDQDAVGNGNDNAKEKPVTSECICWHVVAVDTYSSR